MPALEVEQVTKRFGGLLAVDRVSLAAEENAITTLIGPNGAGKTTLFNVITGFEPLDRGSIRFEGRRIDRLKPWKVARRGMVRTFQTPAGFPKLTVWDNLMVGGGTRVSESLLSAFAGARAWRRVEDEVGRRAREILVDLDLWHRRNTLVEDLTAGETKLVDFARQLMVRPRMLLLDEPASGVDPAHLQRLSQLIKRLKESGIALFVIDHNLSFIMGIADYVYVLADGQVIASGRPDAVSRDPVVIETYLGKVA